MAGLKKYIREVMAPQFKDIVKNYQPSLIFSDGDWWMDDEKWETRPLLAWLFNHGPNKDEVVINDRWGKVRKKHGGYFTTEYGSGFAAPSILWEENRGIGKSFGYSRVETYDDYNSGELLIFMLCDIVSRGGNFLLDIGPTADGRIPVVMTNLVDFLELAGEELDYDARTLLHSIEYNALVEECRESGKPLLAGEFGVLRRAIKTPEPAGERIVEQVNLLAEYGFAGYLLWTFDGHWSNGDWTKEHWWPGTAKENTILKIMSANIPGTPWTHLRKLKSMVAVGNLSDALHHDPPDRELKSLTVNIGGPMPIEMDGNVIFTAEDYRVRVYLPIEANKSAFGMKINGRDFGAINAGELTKVDQHTAFIERTVTTASELVIAFSGESKPSVSSVQVEKR